MAWDLIRRIVLVGVLALISAAVPGEALAGQAKGGTIRVGISEDARTMDPANHRRRVTQTILRNIYDGLLTRNIRMEVVPQLAESWTQRDQLTYDFRLHPGVHFHDGSELTAEDVKFSLERLTRDGAMEGRTSPRRSLLPEFTDIEVIDRYTIRLHLGFPWPHLPAMLPLQEMVSRAFVEEVGAANMDSSANGTGPFRLKHWRSGEEIVLERNDRYYGGARAIPPVSSACAARAVFRPLPNAQARVDALLGGEVDIIDDLPPDAVARVEADAGARVLRTVGTRTFFLAMDVTRPPFADRRVRVAANQAIDRRRVIAEALGGAAQTVNGPLSPLAFGFNSMLTDYGFDPDKARRLLADAGHGDGLDLSLTADPSNREVAAALVKNLAVAGFRTTLRIETASKTRDRWRAGDKAAELWLTSWGNATLDPVGILVPALRSGGRGNFTGYASASVDQLLDNASMNLSRAERAELYRLVQRQVNADVPWVFLWVPEDLYGVSARVRNWNPTPDGRINLHDVCVTERGAKTR